MLHVWKLVFTNSLLLFFKKKVGYKSIAQDAQTTAYLLLELVVPGLEFLHDVVRSVRGAPRRWHWSPLSITHLLLCQLFLPNSSVQRDIKTNEHWSVYTISCMYFSVYLVWQHHAKPLTQPFQLVLQTQILKTFYLYHSFHDMCSWSCSFLLSDSMSNFFPLIHLTSLFKSSSFSDNSFFFYQS